MVKDIDYMYYIIYFFALHVSYIFYILHVIIHSCFVFKSAILVALLYKIYKYIYFMWFCNEKHCVDIPDIVHLYSFKFIIMVMVIVHSLPFHSHFLVISIHFSDDVENVNKTIHFRRFSIQILTMCWTFLLLEFGLPLLCELFVLEKFLLIPFFR